MFDLPENQVEFWYQCYEGEDYELDEDGRRTGDKIPIYSNPEKSKAFISANTGNAMDSPFGNDIVYDKAISTVKKLPIDENTRLFIDRVPVLNADGATDTKPDCECVCVKNGLVQNVWAIRKIKGATG